MRYEVYPDVRRQWRWRLRADNNKTIADSAESYMNKQDCKDAIALVKKSSDAPVIETTS